MGFVVFTKERGTSTAHAQATGPEKANCKLQHLMCKKRLAMTTAKVIGIQNVCNKNTLTHGEARKKLEPTSSVPESPQASQQALSIEYANAVEGHTMNA